MRERAIVSGALVAAALVTGAVAHAASKRGAASVAVDAQVAALRRSALESDLALQLVTGLTTEIGPRPAGSPALQRAGEWASAAMQRLGLENVHTEPVVVPHWERGEGSGAIVAPWPQPMVLTALGGSVGTPEEGITADVVGFPTLEALQAAAPEQVRGRIVFLDRRMQRTRDEHGYAEDVGIRRDGPAVAGKLGARAVLIRSVATGPQRVAHTGMTRYGDAAPIPAAALAVQDADILARELASGQPVRFRLRLTARTLPDTDAVDVLGEVRGATRPDEIVLLGAHLDSWDLGTGAIDDGAGCAIVMAAAKLIAALPRRPDRTVRVVLFANEEFGLSGAHAYAKAHEAELPRHVLAVEADLGADPVWMMRGNASPAGIAFLRAVQRDLAPLGIEWRDERGAGGADLSPLVAAHVPVADLFQDASRYFDYHHSADDTLDKVDPKGLAQNVAAHAVLAWRAATSDVVLGPAPDVKR